MARLVLQTAEGQQIVELRQTNSLGRHPSNTIQLLDKIVSKEHCIVEQRGTMYVLRDLGSLNGTYVNQKRVHGESELKHGDEIALGQTKARFEDTPASHYPPPPSTTAAPGWQQAQVWPPGSPQAPPGSQAVPSGQYPAYVRQPPPNQAFPGQRPPPGPPGKPPAVPPPGPPPLPKRPPPAAMRTPARGFSTAYLPSVPTTTHIETEDEARQIGAEIAATERDFRAFDEIAGNPAQLRADYERLRLSYELTRDIADEKDTQQLLEKILKSIFRFIPAQRGVIFLQDEAGEMQPVASHRNDGGKGAISVSTTILKKVVQDRSAVLTHDAAMDFAASKGKSMILNQIQSAIVAPMLHNEELFGVLWLDSKSLAQFQPKDLELVSAVANQAAMFIEINMLGQQVQDELLTRERLSRLLSPNVAERVIKGQVDVAPGGTRHDVTVYNSDIRGFTRMSEHTPPEEIVEMLNAYFEAMVDTIFKWEGTLDKFMGDGIMAVWGAPMAHPDDPERAVECALEQSEVLGAFNRDRVARGQPALGVGVGIHTGPVVAGYIGSSKALSYTVIGDVANVSARVCAKARAGQIVVSAETRARLGPRFEVEELAPMRIRGKDKPITVFNVVRTRPVSSVPSTNRAGADKAVDSAASATAGAASTSSPGAPTSGAGTPAGASAGAEAE
jgi:adenylate cyclase